MLSFPIHPLISNHSSLCPFILSLAFTSLKSDIPLTYFLNRISTHSSSTHLKYWLLYSLSFLFLNPASLQQNFMPSTLLYNTCLRFLPHPFTIFTNSHNSIFLIQSTPCPRDPGPVVPSLCMTYQSGFAGYLGKLGSLAINKQIL